MYGVGHLWELVVVLLIALIFFGPKRLPELGASLGKTIREFRKSTSEIREGVAELQEESGIAEVRRDLRQGLATLKEETGVAEMRRDVREGLAALRRDSGIDEVRRELSHLERPPG
jgi:TatA/E family protein of Tat protein translocase